MYAFDEYELDTQRYQLRRGAEVIPLEPKVFDVLRYLVEHHDRVATKREMLDALWPGELVSEAVLPTNINAVRRALRQRRGAKTPIETVHGRGYRFTAPVKVAETGVGRMSGVREKAPDSSVIVLADATQEPFVGRRRFMGQLLTGLERALGGEGQLWVLTGEAGIGKSRTSAQVATAAVERGATVWSGQCLDGESAPAYWPWVQVLREAVRGEDEAALRDYFGSALPDIAAILPEVAALTAETVPQPRLTGEQARFRLFDAVARFLVRASDARPRMVVLEDLHWADAPSLHLLKFVACAVPSTSLMLLATVRDEYLSGESDLRRYVDSLTRLRGTQRMHLTGLTGSEVVRYVGALVGDEVEPSVARAMQRRTGGNPLFVREMVRLVRTPGTPPLDDVDAWESQLPQAAADAVRGRLQQVSSEVRQMLAVAAVIGVDFELPVLERLLDREPASLLGALDVALDHGLLLARADRISGYSFSHALVRDALYTGLSVAQRAQWHARIVDVLEGGASQASEDLCFELAHHAYRALPELDAERAVYHTCRAADMAERMHASEDAVVWYRRALDALPFAGSVSLQHVLELRLALARALQATDHYQEARRHAQKVFEDAKAGGLPGVMVDAAMLQSPIDTLRTPTDPSAIDALEAALHYVGEGDHASRARIYSRLARCSRAQRDPAVREAWTRMAVQEAEASGSQDAELEALHARLSELDHPETLEKALALSERLVRRAGEARRPEVSLSVHAMRFRAYLQLGDQARAAAENEEMLYIAHETRDVLHTWHAERHRALSALSRGEFALAEEVLGALAPVGAELHGRLAELYSGTARVWLLRERGDDEDEIRTCRDRLRTGFAHAGGAFRVQGLLLDAELGQTATARRALEELSVDGFAGVLGGADHVSTLAHLAELCVRLRDRDRARFVYVRLAPFGHLNAVDALGHAVGGAHYFLGRLAVLLQRRTDALDHLLRAVDQNVELGMLPALCRTRWQLARLLLGSERAVERERGAGLAAAVQHEAAQLGMRGLLREIESRAR